MAQSGDKRGLVFAAIVAILAAVGIYLTIMNSDSGEPAAEQVGASRTTSSSSATKAGATTAPSPSKPLATASAAPFDVYSYLPMTKQQLAAAADLAERFTAAYGTFSYSEDPAKHADRVALFTTSDLAVVLTRAITSPVTAQQNRDDEVVSQATAKMKEIRQVDRTSVVFVVVGTHQITAKSGKKTRVEEYAVTLTQSGSDWRVFDVQLAKEGQDGDPQG